MTANVTKHYKQLCTHATMLLSFGCHQLLGNWL